jgi:hypothetical protein
MLVKGGVASALALGFPFLKAVTITTLGGMVGAAFFIFFWDKVITTLKKRKLNNEHIANKPPKKIFTFQNKLLIRVKKRFGLFGIAAITPLFSYPFACYFSVRYFQREKQKIFIYTIVSTLVWSCICFSYKLFF